ncbi:MAG: HAD family hydrolase [Candidatus Lokiarchaeota archaeon]|nr:HAD family hydrolase [Candidatus Lokiarchaeota archaeon]
MMPIKAIIWDLDGTLIHFKINSIKARRKAIKVLTDNGIPKKKLSITSPILDNIRISKILFDKNGISENRIEEILKLVNNAVIEVEYEAALNASLIEGIEEVLDFAKKKNLKQAIFTYNTHDNAVISLKTVGITDYFDVIAGRDDIINLKPHPDHLNYICRHLNVDCDEILVVGDTSRDIEAALNVGAHSFALETRIPTYLSREMFQKAEKIIKQEEIPLQLINAIEKLI